MSNQTTTIVMLVIVSVAMAALIGKASYIIGNQTKEIKHLQVLAEKARQEGYLKKEKELVEGLVHNGELLQCLLEYNNRDKEGLKSE